MINFKTKPFLCSSVFLSIINPDIRKAFGGYSAEIAYIDSEDLCY